MSGKSAYLEDAILDHILTSTGYTSPNASLYLSLHTADPTDDDVGTEVDDSVDDTAYARQSITFAAASGGASASSNAQTFAPVVYGSGAAPYTVTHIGIYDAPTGGNLLFSQGILPTRTLAAGEVASFDSGAIIITED